MLGSARDEKCRARKTTADALWRRLGGENGSVLSFAFRSSSSSLSTPDSGVER